MHEYDRSENVNGHPAYLTNGHCLYRNGTTGCWTVADGDDQMKSNKGILRSTAAAELPTQDGLQWQYQSDSRFRAVTGTWKDDAAIVCEGANKVIPWCVSPPTRRASCIPPAIPFVSFLSSLH